MKRVAFLFLGVLGFASVIHSADTNAVTAPAVPDDAQIPPLEQACEKSDLNQVKALIDQGAPIDATTGPYEGTPLMAACMRNADVTRYLISKGAKLDLVDEDGNTALNYACFRAKTDCAQILIDAGANINLANRKGRTPLIDAVRSEDEVLVKALLDHHADVNAVSTGGTALIWATCMNQLAIMKLLVDGGADVNFVPPATKPEDLAYPALHAAAVRGNLPAMDFLFDHHADINLLDCRNVSPLMAAAAYDQIEAVDELLDRGAHLDEQTKESKQSALMVAAKRGYLDVAEALVSNGANVQLKDKDGRTALLLAARALDGRIVRLLATNGADENATDSMGETALNYAGNRGGTALVKWLKDSGATKTDLHVIALPRPQPPLPAAQSWALSMSAVYAQVYGANPNILGYGLLFDADLTRQMRDKWKVTDRYSLQQALDDLQKGGPAAEWREKGAKVVALSDDTFKTILAYNSAAFAKPVENRRAWAIRRNYLKWKDRTGLAWTLCVSANLVNCSYNARYIDGKEAWYLLQDIAVQMQKNFSSWQEMSDNFLDGREISIGGRDPYFEACVQLLLNPNDPNSPWNQNPWKTDLTARAGNWWELR